MTAPETPAPPEPDTDTGDDGNGNGGESGEGRSRTFTQEQVNAINAEERRRRLDAEKALEAERALVKQAEQRSKEGERQLADEQLRSTKYRVALDKGLPLVVAERLQGDSEDALAEDADKLVDLLKAPSDDRAALLGGGAQPQPLPPDDMNARIRAGVRR